jgi:uncharacterized protein (DUF2249 family)
VIRATDRVADVLASDPALIEVFIAVSPAFARLRNAAMRRVMARLVTVEQAARIGGVDSADLISKLNRAGTTATAQEEMTMQDATNTTAASAASRPAELSDLDARNVKELNVRQDLWGGREPFSRIMAARAELGQDQVLKLRAIFEPVPLYGVFAKQGFTSWTEQLAPDDWAVWFYRPAAPLSGATDPGSQSDDRSADSGAESENADPGVVELDVRGLEPPEPMVRTLAALESLPRGHTLVQINVKEPRFLLPQLTERGFVYEVRAQGPDLTRVFIRHADRVLDVRVIPPREKHPAIFETFKALAPGESFILVNDHDPKPLRYQFEYEHAGEFGWEYLEEGPSVWRVEIARVV